MQHGMLVFAAMKRTAAKIDVGNYMRDVDRTLLRENLKLSFEQRAQKHLRVLQTVEELRRAGKKLETEALGVDWFSR
jgi:hypothetical protein